MLGLITTYCRDQFSDTVKIIAKRYTEVKEFEKAGDYYESAGMVEYACKCFIASGHLDRASDLLSKVRDPEIKQKLSGMMQEARIREKTKNSDVQGVTDLDAKKGIEMLVKSGNWSQALDTAKRKDANLFNEYLLKYLNEIVLPQGLFNDGLKALANFGMPVKPMNIEVYRKLIDETFAACEPEEIENLRKALRNFMDQIQPNDRTKGIGKEFARFQLATHLIHQKHEIEKKNMPDLLVKINVSLVRYVDLTTIDKPFYEAGQLALKMKMENVAFVFLNRYLDIFECIEGGNLQSIEDNEAFNCTDIPRLNDLRLPAKNEIDDRKKGAIRDWCLKTSLEKNDVIPLPTIPCPNCSSPLFEVNFE